MKVDRRARLVRSMSLFCPVVMLFAAACAAPKPKVEEPLAQLAPAVEQPPMETVKTPPPGLEEVNKAVTRVFRDAAIIPSERQPNFVTGDFNGDQSMDVAVLIKPASGKLAELNQEYPPWILKNVFLSDRPGSVPPKVTENELLLAVIHGYGPNGWRDREATQTFLLKNVAGSNLQIQQRETVLKTNTGKKLPRLRGDVISELLNGRNGWLYYADATYQWYDPDTFKGEPERRLVHPGVSVGMPK